MLSLLLALAGALSAATVARQLGGVALVAGWGLSLVALHRFGRQSAAAPPPASDLAAEDGDPDSRA